MTIARQLTNVAYCCLFAALLTGCGGGQQSNESNQSNIAEDARNYVARGATDARFIDPEVIGTDVLLAAGDQNVEEELGSPAEGRFSAMNTLIKVHPNPSITPHPGGYADNAVATASMYMGRPYEYGSDRTNPVTFDCSDFTRWSYLAGLGMDIPPDSRSQARYVQAFSNRVYWDIRQARRGDLLFFIGYLGGYPQAYDGADKSIERISHVGIALGDGRMIHTASAKTGGVRIDPITDNHLQYRFVFGGSVLETK